MILVTKFKITFFRTNTQSQIYSQIKEKQKLQVRMGAIKHKILVLAGKGGVGKSSVAAGLALSLTKQGFSVGLLDVDICGPSIPRLLDLQSQQVVNSDYGWIPPS